MWNNRQLNPSNKVTKSYLFRATSLRRNAI